jgi:hypothetical protein
VETRASTVTLEKAHIHGLMLFSLMLGMVSFLLLFWWLLIHRFRLQYLEARLDEVGLDAAIAERRAEAGGRTALAEVAG